MPRMPSEIPSNQTYMYGPYYDTPEEKKSCKITANDAVNGPIHYNRHGGSIECLDAIKASMSKEQYLGLLKGSAMQYLWRYDLKGGEEDLKKGQFYLNLLLEEYNKES